MYIPPPPYNQYVRMYVLPSSVPVNPNSISIDWTEIALILISTDPPTRPPGPEEYLVDKWLRNSMRPHITKINGYKRFFNPSISRGRGYLTLLWLILPVFSIKFFIAKFSPNQSKFNPNLGLRLALLSLSESLDIETTLHFPKF